MTPVGDVLYVCKIALDTVIKQGDEKVHECAKLSEHLYSHIDKGKYTNGEVIAAVFALLRVLVTTAHNRNGETVDDLRAAFQHKGGVN